VGSVSVDLEWRENRAGGAGFVAALRETWAYRQLLWSLTVRNLIARFKQTALGVLWALVQPIVGAIVFTLVFNRLAGVDLEDGSSYLLFSYVGASVWTYYSQATGAAVTSLVDNADLVTKVAFPRFVIPAALAMSPILDLLIGLVLFIPLAIVFGANLTWAVVTVPIWLALLVVFAVVPGATLAAMHVRYRDVLPIINFGLSALLFLSPVAYPAELADGFTALLRQLNPLALVLTGLRWSLGVGDAPPADGWLTFGVLVVIVILGLRYFFAAERRFADVI